MRRAAPQGLSPDRDRLQGIGLLLDRQPLVGQERQGRQGAERVPVGGQGRREGRGGVQGRFERRFERRVEGRERVGPERREEAREAEGAIRLSRARIGIFGGSGFYSLLDRVEQVEVDTPYGKPSAPVAIGDIGGVSTAFLPRHGLEHEYPPHTIPYRANLWEI